MKQVLCGYRPYDFDDGKGRRVQGTSLYTQYEQDGVTGYITGKINANRIPSNIDDFLGLEMEFDFDPKGKLVQIAWPDLKPASVGSGTAEPKK